MTLKKLNSTGPFLKRPGNFSGPKSNIQVEINRVRTRVLAKKLLHFVSLTDSFMLDAKLLKPRSLMFNGNSLPCPLIIGTFKKRAPGLSCSKAGYRYPLDKSLSSG